MVHYRQRVCITSKKLNFIPIYSILDNVSIILNTNKHEKFTRRKLRRKFLWPKKNLTEKISLFTSKLNIEFKNKLVGCYTQKPGHHKNWGESIWKASKCGAGGE